jgi:hypothetical protein
MKHLMRRKLNGTQSAKSTGFDAFQTSGATFRRSDHGMAVTQKVDFPDYTGRACLKTFPAGFTIAGIHADVLASPGATEVKFPGATCFVVIARHKHPKETIKKIIHLVIY